MRYYIYRTKSKGIRRYNSNNRRGNSYREDEVPLVRMVISIGRIEEPMRKKLPSQAPKKMETKVNAERKMGKNKRAKRKIFGKTKPRLRLFVYRNKQRRSRFGMSSIGSELTETISRTLAQFLIGKDFCFFFFSPKSSTIYLSLAKMIVY